MLPDPFKMAERFHVVHWADSCLPIIKSEAGDAAEFLGIVGHKNHFISPGNRCNEQCRLSKRLGQKKLAQHAD